MEVEYEEEYEYDYEDETDSKYLVHFECENCESK